MESIIFPMTGWSPWRQVSDERQCIPPSHKDSRRQWPLQRPRDRALELTIEGDRHIRPSVTAKGHTHLHQRSDPDAARIMAAGETVLALAAAPDSAIKGKPMGPSFIIATHIVRVNIGPRDTDEESSVITLVHFDRERVCPAAPFNVRDCPSPAIAVHVSR